MQVPASRFEEVFHPVCICASDRRLARYIFETYNEVDSTARKYCIYAEPDEYCKMSIRLSNNGHGGRTFYIELQQNGKTVKHIKTSNLWKLQDVQWPEADPENKHCDNAIDYHVYQGHFASADFISRTPPQHSMIPLDAEGWGWHNVTTPWLNTQTAKTVFKKECADNEMEVYRIRESIKANKVLCYCNDDAAVIETDKKSNKRKVAPHSDREYGHQLEGAILGCEDKVCKFQTFVFDPLCAPPFTKANITEAEAQEQLEVDKSQSRKAPRKHRKSARAKILSRGKRNSQSSATHKQY